MSENEIKTLAADLATTALIIACKDYIKSCGLDETDEGKTLLLMLTKAVEVSDRN